MKILLVEDSATLRLAMCGFIRKAGHEAVVAESGEEALQLVEANPVDMVIMDVEMPGLDGFETTRLIREFFGERWVPIIFVTGMSDEDSYQKGIEAGGDDYMIKPVSPIILTAKLRAFERIVDMQQQLQDLNQELQALSQRDGLTDLYNRRAYEEKARLQWQVSTRAREPVAVLMIDVDHFKEFNDHYGHQAGDDCLKQVARTLREGLHRPADILARYGGEEFIILLPNTSVEGARIVAEALREAVRRLAVPHARSSTAERVTVSIGAAVAEHTSGMDEHALAREADEALYRAKSRGRDRVEVRQLSAHKTLLIMEADSAAMGATGGILGQRFNIVTAATASECVEIAHNCWPDLILFSAGAPGEMVAEVRKSLLNNRHTAGIPVVQLETGLDGDDRLLEKVEAALG